MITVRALPIETEAAYRYTQFTIMRRPILWLTAGLLALIGLAVCFRARRPLTVVFTPAPAMGGEPNLMLWAWETPEDFRGLNPDRAGVAYLSRELLLGSNLEVRSRHQQLLLPENVFLAAVVRIETSPAFRWSNANISSIAAQIAAAAQAPHTRALQVDFDARVSERPFYSMLLRDLRQQLPPTIALSTTALTSWCGHDNWLHVLPIDEAVPMFFRMGGPASIRAAAPRNFADIEEPLCTGSVGVSTDELWPSIDSRQRVYLFHVGSWSAKDLALVNAGSYRDLQSLARPSTQTPSP
jgi:Protein of unknown function (DUF3142)